MFKCYDCQKDQQHKASKTKWRRGADGKKYPLCDMCYKEMRLKMNQASRQYVKDMRTGV